MLDRQCSRTDGDYVTAKRVSMKNTRYQMIHVCEDWAHLQKTYKVPRAFILQEQLHQRLIIIKNIHDLTISSSRKF